jgi:CRP-like cAMP-binding protein
MFQALAAYLKEKTEITEEELKRVEDAVIPKKLRKRQYFLQEGDISHYIGFVVKGCLRLYHIGDDGTEHNLRFSVENWWVADYVSYDADAPSKNNIEALEDSELLLFEKKDFDTLFEEIPCLKRLREKLEKRNFEVHQQRILSNISESAEERYNSFIKSYPHIFNRVPLQMVASYLGVSRETLSRIRQQHYRL